VVACCLGVAVTALVGCSNASTSNAAQQSAIPTTQGAQADPRFLAADLPLLPFQVVSAIRPLPVMRAVYEFAARHPEVLRYVPCFCGCEAGGHKDNHDCFVAKRGADSRVLEWDTHGIGCAICADVATRAMLLFNAGQSVASIRGAVEKEFSPIGHGRTPTPMPRSGGN